MNLSVILVYYKSRDDLLTCLAGLPDAAGGFTIEIVVIDNASHDGIAEALAEWYPDVRLITNSENVGYARAVNQGLAATRSEFALVMNPDCRLRAGAARRLAEYLVAHPRTAIAGPRILNPDGTLEYSARSFPGPFTFLFNRYSLLTRLFPRNRWTREYLLSDWDHASVRDVGWLSGACMMVRREAVTAVGGMDEAFFMFNEDVDWCRRMALADWGVTYVPDAVCVHAIGASRRSSPRVIWERHRGMIHYFHKHHSVPPPLSWLADAFVLARAGLMLAANALRGR